MKAYLFDMKGFKTPMKEYKLDNKVSRTVLKFLGYLKRACRFSRILRKMDSWVV